MKEFINFIINIRDYTFIKKSELQKLRDEKESLLHQKAVLIEQPKSDEAFELIILHNIGKSLNDFLIYGEAKYEAGGFTDQMGIQP